MGGRRTEEMGGVEGDEDRGEGGPSPKPGKIPPQDFSQGSALPYKENSPENSPKGLSRERASSTSLVMVMEEMETPRHAFGKCYKDYDADPNCYMCLHAFPCCGWL